MQRVEQPCERGAYCSFPPDRIAVVRERDERPIEAAPATLSSMSEAETKHRHHFGRRVIRIRLALESPAAWHAEADDVCGGVVRSVETRRHRMRRESMRSRLWK